MCGDGGELVEFWWSGGVVLYCLEFWLVGDVLVGFSNGILMEFSISSIEVPFGSSVGVSLACRSSRW